MHTRFPSTRLSAETHMHMGLSCVKTCSERARERVKWTFWQTAMTKLVCPLLPCRSYGLHRQVPVRSSGKESNMRDFVSKWRLQVADKHFMSNVEQAWVHGRQTVIARLYFMSSMTEVVISEVFKRSVLWDNRFKDCHNRNFVDKE